MHSVLEMQGVQLRGSGNLREAVDFLCNFYSCWHICNIFTAIGKETAFFYSLWPTAYGHGF